MDDRRGGLEDVDVSRSSAPSPPSSRARAPALAYTYVVRCADGSLYTGFAHDVNARVAVHNLGRGARFTRSRQPVGLLWWWRSTPEHARRLEGLLKRQSRREKLLVVANQPEALLPLLREVAHRMSQAASPRETSPRETSPRETVGLDAARRVR